MYILCVSLQRALCGSLQFTSTDSTSNYEHICMYECSYRINNIRTYILVHLGLGDAKTFTFADRYSDRN